MPQITSADGLTNKQRRFVAEYVKHSFGARAARLAGYSEHSARQIAYDLLQRPLAAELVAESIKEQSELAHHAFIAARDRRMFAAVQRRKRR